MSFSILEYLGKVADGILVLLSVILDDEYYEATFFYNKTNFILTISEELEEKIGLPIQLHPEYKTIVKTINEKVVPFDELWENLDDINLDRWTKNS